MTESVTADPADVVERPELGRFELGFAGGQAFAVYRPIGDRLYVSHTEVPQAFNGRGVGSALVEGVFRIARASGRTVVPGCGFVAAWARRHPEWSDLVSR